MKSLRILILLLVCNFAFADTAAQQAWTIHNRIAGVPPAPKSGVLEQMANEIRKTPGRAGLESAAEIAMQNRFFYDLVLKNWIKPWGNVETSKRVPLNDFVSTIIGAIRDSDQPGKPFSRILYEDLIYVGPATGNADNNFARNNNNHYAAIETRDISLVETLVERRQTQAINTEAGVTSDSTNILVDGENGAAGVITTRAFGDAYFNMGTNRRVVRYTLVNFMCKDLEDIHDTTLPDIRVRRDVSRTPGGDSRAFKNKCVGCHAGMDGLGGAFAYYDYIDGALRYQPGTVQDKLNRLPAYMNGYETVDDSWINFWGELSSHNDKLGFKAPFSGNGAAALGRAVASSRAFSICMAKKTFKLLCIRPPQSRDDTFIEQMANKLEENGQYNMKQLFASTISYCVEDKYAN